MTLLTSSSMMLLSKMKMEIQFQMLMNMNRNKGKMEMMTKTQIKMEMTNLKKKNNSLIITTAITTIRMSHCIKPKAIEMLIAMLPIAIAILKAMPI